MKFQVGPASVEMIEDGDRVCAHIAAGRTFEPRTLEIWADLCVGGGVVIDVGGYTGLFSISAALLGCKVIAFEPMPFNAERLNENAKRNGVRDQIRLIEAAACDRIGSGEITYNPKVAFTSGASLIRKKGVRLPITLTTIDMLSLDQVTAIKIDVERGEPLVLAGARETIARHKPPILIEVLDAERKAGVLIALPDYRVAEEIDERNWFMLPC